MLIGSLATPKLHCTLANTSLHQALIIHTTTVMYWDGLYSQIV